MERMLRIHQLLRSQEYPNCARLVRELELCTRTIKRDLDFMKYRLDLPIEFDPRRNGYYYTCPVEQFPGVAVTEAEMFALLVAHKAIAQYLGTPFEQPLMLVPLTKSPQTWQDSSAGNAPRRFYRSHATE